MIIFRAVAVVQLAEQSLLTPEVCSSNHVIGIVYCQLYWKDETKEKRPGMAHLKKIMIKFNSHVDMLKEVAG